MCFNRDFLYHIYCMYRKSLVLGSMEFKKETDDRILKKRLFFIGRIMFGLQVSLI